MALHYPAAAACKRVVKELEAAGKVKPYHLLSFSYQDLILSQNELIDLLGLQGAAEVIYREDSPEIVRWHKCQEFCPKVPEAHQFYKAIGFGAITDVDLVRARGTEVIGDLNYQLPLKIKKRHFDLVIDNVSQHCMNVGNALLEIESRVAVGGYVMHVIPLSAINQGYYNICPMMLVDFYRSRGYTVLCHVGMHFDRAAGTTTVDIDSDARMVTPGDNYWQVFVARKDQDIIEKGWPLQRKFQQYPDSKIPIIHRKEPTHAPGATGK